MRPSFILAVAAMLSLASYAQSDYGNYETSYVHPVRISPDGSRLFALNTPCSNLEVYSLADPDRPLLLKRIPVGLEASSLAIRDNDEVWVVDTLGDSVSIVSVREGRVVETLDCKDEPYDVAFAGNPLRAFVSVAASDEVRVFDVATRQQVAVIPVFGKDPRALAVDPSGQKVYVAVHRSGNKTVLLDRFNAPPPPIPLNPALPAAPQTGLIVHADDPTYSSLLPISLPDNDVAEIDANSASLVRYFGGIGTILFDLAVDASTGDIFVANTDARNLVRFEPNVRGHAIDSRVTRIVPSTTPVVTPIDLNPGINYAVLPNPSAMATALAEPTAVVAANGAVWVAAQGTDRIALLDATGQIQARIELGYTGTSTLRGPRGLALHPTSSRLYVFNRMTNGVSIIDTAARTVVGEFALSGDPTPAVIKAGRRFLYDARLSGNGTMSCASCHVDGDHDFLAWDLGDPAGVLQPTPLQAPPFDNLPPFFHPMKGPLLTQTLRGMGNLVRFHWRGDRAGLAEFNANFVTLMGGSMLSPSDMATFETYMFSLRTQPNPNLTLEGDFSPVPAGNNALDGLAFFFNAFVPFSTNVNLACGTCHNPPIGTNSFLISPTNFFDTQPFRVAPILNSYRRLGKALSGPSKAGFGIGHDGAFADVAHFLTQPEFTAWPASMKDDIDAYMLSIKTGSAPTIGYPAMLDQARSNDPAIDARVNALMSESVDGECEVVASGSILGHRRELAFDDVAGHFVADHPAFGPYTYAQLKSLAASDDARLLIQGVTPGTSQRHALDGDRDGIPDGIDGLETYGSPGLGSAGIVLLEGNREPHVGDQGFAFVTSGTLPSVPGVWAFSALPASIPVLGLVAYIDFNQPLYFTTTGFADPSGLAALPAPIAALPALAGFTLYVQSLFFDPGVPLGYVASNGLRFQIQP